MRPARTLVFVATLALGLTVVAACGSDSSNKSSTTTTESGVTVTTVANGTPVAIVVNDTSGTNGPMTMTVAPATVAAGPVTFTVKNTGTIKHEMVVLKTDAASLTVGSDGKVSEKTTAGEVGDVEPGKSASVTLDLEAGQYELVCNIKDHYKMGMHTSFTVT